MQRQHHQQTKSLFYGWRLLYRPNNKRFKNKSKRMDFNQYCLQLQQYDVIFIPWAVKRFRPDSPHSFSPWLKCNILFRAEVHPVRKLRVATIATKGQIKAWNWNSVETRISWKCLFKLRITSTLQQWPGHEAVWTVLRHCHLQGRFSANLSAFFKKKNFKG